RARRPPRPLLRCPRAERSRVSALYCEISGRGRDLVLLHGWGLNLRVWDGLAGALTARFRVIAIDLPGHGRSDWDASAGTPAAQAWRVHETLAPLTRRYALLGWSLGGQGALAAHGPAQPEALARGLDRLRCGDLRPALPLVRIPALVVSGGLDRITPAAAGRALAAALPKGRYVEFARAAHAPFLSSPAR